MNPFIKTSVAGIVALFVSATMFHSCRDYNATMFPEFDNLQTDSFHLEGAVAVPMVDTKIKISDFIPESDSSLWVEVAGDGLLHVRMFYKDLISLRMDEIYPDVNYSGSNQGDVVAAEEHFFVSAPEKMKIHDKSIAGHVFFNNPKITFFIRNEIPLVNFFRMDTVHFFNFIEERLTHAEDESTIIQAPVAEGGIASTPFLIDTTRIPVLDEAFSPVPHKIGFYVTAGSSVSQNLPYNVNGSERISADVDIDLPLEVRLVDLFLGDTLDFAWDGTNYEQARSVTLKIEFDNGLPFEGIGQIYFADTTNMGTITHGNLIDSVFTDISMEDIDSRGWIFGSAATDGVGIVTQSNKSLINIELTQERIAYLKKMHACKVILGGRFNHDPSNNVPNIHVRLMDDYKLGIKMGVKLDYSGNTNEGL